MIQFLLPLLGSLGGGALAGQLGGGLLAKALLTGGGSFLGSKLAGADTEDALMSGLLAGGLGAFSGLGGGGANAAQEATKAAAAMPANAAGGAAATAKGLGSLGMMPSEMMALKMAGGGGAMPGAAQAAQQAHHLMPGAPGGGGGGLGSLRGIGNWIQENPGLALMGGGALASAFQNAPPVPTSSDGPGMGAQEQFPTRAGPRQGYQRANMTEEQYRRYGQVGGPSSTEFAFFEDAGLTGAPLDGPGGPVTGGAPGTDTVPAQGPGGQPFRLNNGEYVLPRDMVRAIGRRNLDEIRSRFV